MSSVHVAAALNPYTGEWVTFPKPALVGTDHLACFEAENNRRFAQEWNTEHPGASVDVPDGAKACPVCAPHFDYADSVMRDLHTAIRQRLADRPIITTDTAPEAAPRINNWVSKAHNALAALLDWHALGYHYGEEPGKLPNWCHACNDIGPCDTVQIIARELGIGARDGIPIVVDPHAPSWTIDVYREGELGPVSEADA